MVRLVYCILIEKAFDAAILIVQRLFAFSCGEFPESVLLVDGDLVDGLGSHDATTPSLSELFG